MKLNRNFILAVSGAFALTLLSIQLILKTGILGVLALVATAILAIATPKAVKYFKITLSNSENNFHRRRKQAINFGRARERSAR